MRVPQPIYVGGLPLHQTEPFDDRRKSQRTPFKRRPTSDEDVLRYRAELKKRGLLATKPLSKPRHNRKETCVRGHPNIPENRYQTVRGRSQCRLCVKIRRSKMFAATGGNARKEAMPNYGKRKSA